MTPQIRLQPRSLADLRRIQDIGQDRLKRVVAEVGKLPPLPVHAQELQEVMSKSLNGNVADADILVRQLLSLHGLQRQLNLDSEEIFGGLTSGLQESSGDKSEVARWESVSAIFRELFELPIVRISAKALDLSYQHSHLLQRSQIITDIRPLFDNEATTIQGTIISHKFLLRYDDIEGEHLLSLAVDEKDLKSLIKQCQRALQKSEVVKKRLEQAELKTLIPGEEQR